MFLAVIVFDEDHSELAEVVQRMGCTVSPSLERNLGVFQEESCTTSVESSQKRSKRQVSIAEQ